MRHRPGAGFTTTHGYVPDLPKELPDYQEACLHVYDAIDYAENAFDVPIVAYSGEKDKQKAAADNIEARLKAAGLKMTHIVAPGLEHQMPDEWKTKVEAELAKYVAKGRPNIPKQVRFVTYTLKYPACDWVTLLALEQHYRRASVDAELIEDMDGVKGATVKTANVRLLELTFQLGGIGNVIVNIDGQKIETAPYLIPEGSAAHWRHVYLQRRDSKWSAVWPEKLATEQGRRPYKGRMLTAPASI